MLLLWIPQLRLRVSEAALRESTLAVGGNVSAHLCLVKRMLLGVLVPIAVTGVFIVILLIVIIIFIAIVLLFFLVFFLLLLGLLLDLRRALLDLLLSFLFFFS